MALLFENITIKKMVQTLAHKPDYIAVKFGSLKILPKMVKSKNHAKNNYIMKEVMCSNLAQFKSRFTFKLRKQTLQKITTNSDKGK